jgi:hypothetical protein
VVLVAARAAMPPFGVLVTGAGPLPLLDGRRDGVLYACRHATCDAPLAEADSVAPALAVAARWEADGR